MVEIKNRKRKYDALSMNKGIKTIEDLIGIIEDYDTTFYEFKKLKRLYISDVLLDAYNGTPLSIGHMNINEIIGDKIELIIINLPNYPK